MPKGSSTLDPKNSVTSPTINVMRALERADADVKATTGGERGGEGYVAQKSKIKLVPRTRWQPN